MNRRSLYRRTVPTRKQKGTTPKKTRKLTAAKAMETPQVLPELLQDERRQLEIKTRRFRTAIICTTGLIVTVFCIVIWVIERRIWAIPLAGAALVVVLDTWNNHDLAMRRLTYVEKKPIPGMTFRIIRN